MFDNVDTSKELSARLRQDMNPGREGVVSPPSAPPPPQPLPKPAPPPPLENKQPSAEEIAVPEVETAPFIPETSNKVNSVLAWSSIILVMPPVFFWFCSLLYVAGSKAVLVKIVTTVPFIIIVVANVSLPIVTIILALLMLKRTEPGEDGRGLAKLAIVFAILTIIALFIWLITEVF